MGDKLVDDVLRSLQDSAFANGIALRQWRVAVDTLVNRLRGNGGPDGLSDLTIRALLVVGNDAKMDGSVGMGG